MCTVFRIPGATMMVFARKATPPNCAPITTAEFRCSSTAKRCVPGEVSRPPVRGGGLAVGAFDLPGTPHTRRGTIGLGRERTGCTVPPFITGFHHSFAPRFDSFGHIDRRRLNHRNLSSRDEIRFTLRHHPGSQSAHSAEPTPNGIETARTTIPVTSVQRPIAFLIDGPPRT